MEPEAYSHLRTRRDLLAVGRVVSLLNKGLPKRRFILMGPGRWGSRGDIRLGVSVTYSDINNTAMLIEIARKKGEYVPEVSFGTHFFQDLVEESIRYLPLFPDDDDVDLNESFLTTSKNILPDLLPQCADLNEVVKVIDVPRSSGGQVLDVLMNDEVNRALGLLVPLSAPVENEPRWRSTSIAQHEVTDHWRWRQHMAEEIAATIDPVRFGVAAAYLIGSAKNANAGPRSDIDLIFHVTGSKKQEGELLTWLEGWSHALSEMNYLRTGIRIPGLLHVHLVTGDEIQKRKGYAAKIDAISDSAQRLPLGAAREAE